MSIKNNGWKKHSLKQKLIICIVYFISFLFITTGFNDIFRENSLNSSNLHDKIFDSNSQEFSSKGTLTRGNIDIMIFAPHPDDEALATAGVIYDAIQKGKNIKIVYLTVGDGYPAARDEYMNNHVYSEYSVFDINNNHYLEMTEFGRLRRQEAITAMNSLGVYSADLIWLGYPDHYLFDILSSPSNSAIFSTYTQTNDVPYSFAESQYSLNKRTNVVSDIKNVLNTHTPSEIYIPHELDAHKDHSATYHFISIALNELGLSPNINKYIIHWYYSSDSASVPKKYSNEMIWLSSYKKGIEYSDSSNVEQSSRYENGILMSKNNQGAWAKYDLQVQVNPTKLEVGMFYSDEDWINNGPTLKAWNWNYYDVISGNNGRWETIIEDADEGMDIEYHTEISATDYVDQFGCVKLKVVDDWYDITDLALVYAYSEPPSSFDIFSSPDGIYKHNKELKFDTISFTQNLKLNLINYYASEVEKDPEYMRSFAKNNEIFWEEKSYKFIQITDTHIGQPWYFKTEENRFQTVISEINIKNPAFVIITGDLVDSLTDRKSPSDLIYKHNMQTFDNIITDPVKGLKVPYYLTVGNHDYRPYLRIPPNFKIPWPGVNEQSTMNSEIDNYLTIFNPLYSPKNDYSFDYGNTHFIAMNSGHDEMSGSEVITEIRWQTPEGSGLSSNQIIWLKNELSQAYLAGKNIIIFMHHPAVNSNDDKGLPGFGGLTDNALGGNDACIAHNRSDFIKAVSDNDVAMVVTGHSHKNKKLDKYGSEYPLNTWDPDVGTMYVQTNAAIDYGYREITIDSITGEINTITGVFNETSRINLSCPANLHVYNSSNNHVGYTQTGGIDVQISDSYYFPGNNKIPDVISVSYGSNYRIEIEGNGTGFFNLTIENLLFNNYEVIEYKNFSVCPNTHAYINISHPNPDYSIFIDFNGSGNYVKYSPTSIYSTQLNLQQNPIADAGPDLIGNEGEPVQFDGSNSRNMDGEIISYDWDFNGDGQIDASGIRPTYIWYDNTVAEVTLIITYVIYEIDFDSQGNMIRTAKINTSTDTLTVTVLNVDPTVTIDRAYMYVDFTLRAAGEKWHDVTWTLFENDVPIASLHVERYPGDPDKQSETVYDVYIDMEKVYIFNATYNPYEDDNPINGQLNGANPIWIILTFEDGSQEKIHHTFNVQQSIIKGSDHWLHVEPWWVDLSPWFVNHTVTFEATITDPGTDDENLTWDFGDGSPTIQKTYRWDGVNHDGGSTPYDLHEGTYPNIIHDVEYHIYNYEGDFIVTLTSRDDDFGIDDDILDIEAIHTRYICPRI